MQKRYTLEDKQFSSIVAYEDNSFETSYFQIHIHIRYDKRSFDYKKKFHFSNLSNVQINNKHVFTMLTTNMRNNLFNKITEISTIRHDFNVICDAAQDKIFKWRLDHGLFAESHGCCPFVWDQPCEKWGDEHMDLNWSE